MNDSGQLEQRGESPAEGAATTVALPTLASSRTAEPALRSRREPVHSLYIHIPFCFHKCHYCDFYSLADQDVRQPAYTDALLLELRALARRPGATPVDGAKPRLRTIFVGGGTPTLLRIDLWERVLAALHDSFEFADQREGFEFTVECNPETAATALFRLLRAGGANRISIGAQSFDSRHLKTLERWHDPANVQRALALAAGAGFERRSVDLIYGVPGQTLEDARRDIETALALDPGVEHLSAYALTYEPNTAMTARLRRAEFTPCDDDLEADMAAMTVERLGEAGFERYEVSNFAKPGAPATTPGTTHGTTAACRHNLAYWRQESWLAAGPSASGHVRLAQRGAGGWRWKNTPRLNGWIDGVTASAGWSPVTDLEAPDPARALRERLMTGVRIAEGVEEESILDAARALGVVESLRAAVDREVDRALLERDAGRLRPTALGFAFADGVARRLMHSIAPGATIAG